MDLGGTWRAAVADDDLRRVYAEPSYDDDGWIPVDVPGHWRSTPAFATTDGPVLYRRSFTTDGIDDGQRAWLEFEGTFYQSDVYLDDSYLGDTEGYFFPHRFEITDQLVERDDHVLAVEVASSPPSDLSAKRSITGVFDHWDAMDPDGNAGGIWRPVRITTTGPIRIHHYRCLCSRRLAGPLPPCRSAPCSARPSRPTSNCAPPCADRRARPNSSRTSISWRRGRTGSSGRSPSTTPTSGGRTPSASLTCTTSTSPSARWTAPSRTVATTGSDCARSNCTTGSPRSTANGSTSRGPTKGRPGSIWPTPPGPTSAATSTSLSTVASTCCGSTAM